VTTHVRTDPLRQAVSKVLANDNCSGCGACALISDRITMSLSNQGYLRPELAAAAQDGRDPKATASFQGSSPWRPPSLAQYCGSAAAPPQFWLLRFFLGGVGKRRGDPFCRQ
jgi:coenzyme F420 hydrogenase subunit beta